MIRVSGVVITRDEERHVGRCLASLRPVVDELLVVDSGSTDATERICREAGAEFVVQPWLGYGPQKRFAAGRARGEWILSLDADEALSEPLAAAIREATAAPAGPDAYELNRLNWYYDRFLRHGGFYPEWKLRLWRRGAAAWTDDAVHEVARPVAGARVGHLPGDLLHYTVFTREQHLATIERFTTLMAEGLWRDGRAGSAWRRWVTPAVTFARTYLLKAGFLDGRAGLTAARLSAYAAWLKYDKLRRLAREPRHG